MSGKTTDLEERNRELEILNSLITKELYNLRLEVKDAIQNLTKLLEKLDGNG